MIIENTEWTSKRYWQHLVQKTQDKDNQNKTKNKRRKLKRWRTRAFTDAFTILYIKDITLWPKNDLSLWPTNDLTFDPKWTYPCDLHMTYPCCLQMTYILPYKWSTYCEKKKRLFCLWSLKTFFTNIYSIYLAISDILISTIVLEQLNSLSIVLYLKQSRALALKAEDIPISIGSNCIHLCSISWSYGISEDITVISSYWFEWNIFHHENKTLN